jgi:hypothetical protein
MTLARGPLVLCSRSARARALRLLRETDRHRLRVRHVLRGAITYRGARYRATPKFLGLATLLWCYRLTPAVLSQHSRNTGIG